MNPYGKFGLELYFIQSNLCTSLNNKIIKKKILANDNNNKKYTVKSNMPGNMSAWCIVSNHLFWWQFVWLRCCFHLFTTLEMPIFLGGKLLLEVSGQKLVFSQEHAIHFGGTQIKWTFNQTNYHQNEY